MFRAESNLYIFLDSATEVLIKMECLLFSLRVEMLIRLAYCFACLQRKITGFIYCTRVLLQRIVKLKCYLQYWKQN
jgi:hypothetical protein